MDEQAIILKAEEDMFKQALVELERYHERYEYLQDNIVYVDLPSPVVQDFSYQPMPIIKRYIKELEDKQAHLNQVGEGLEQEKSRLEQFCQEELQDIKLRRMVVNGLKYLDNYQEVEEWKNRLSSRIALAIRHAEDDMREHDRQLQQFINHILMLISRTMIRKPCGGWGNKSRWSCFRNFPGVLLKPGEKCPPMRDALTFMGLIGIMNTDFKPSGG